MYGISNSGQNITNEYTGKSITLKETKEKVIVMQKKALMTAYIVDIIELMSHTTDNFILKFLSINILLWTQISTRR